MSFIENRVFTRKTGKTYEVVRTVSTGPQAHEANDYVKSHETGKVIKMPRLETLRFIAE